MRIASPASFGIFLVLIGGMAAIWLNDMGVAQSDDARRADNVMKLSWRVWTFAGLYHRLPRTLAELEKNGFGRNPIDPDTRKSYEYLRVDGHTFRLCTTFNNVGIDGSAPFFPGPNRQAVEVIYGDPLTHGYGTWKHGAGYQCLDRTLQGVNN
jgi:hypothetical protein